MDRDKNLLFGVLAVQLRKASPSQIMEAAAAWAASPEKDIPNRLVDAKVISADDRDLLLSLVNEAVVDHGGDPSAALHTFREAQRVYESLERSITPPTVKGAPLDELPADLAHLRSLSEVREQPGRYWLKSEHARGGQGRLLLVHDESLGRDIILKELLNISDSKGATPTPVRQSASMIARFLQEAKVTSQLEHPTIVPVYEVGIRPDSTPYYTMKLLKGRDLAGALRDCKGLEDRLRLLRHFVDVCHGLAYAHLRGVIHRDLKPHNIMVGQFGETVILDWGLAKIKGRPDAQRDAFEKTITSIKVGHESDAGKTQPGAILGTPAYMSPEQAQGKLNAVDERSDVYGLGMILYEIIAGRLPFEKAPAISILEKVAAEAPPSCKQFQPDAPPELVAICDRCLERDPEKRYQSAAELAEEIERFTSGALVGVYRYTFREIATRYYRRHRTMVNAVAAFFLVLLGLGVFSYINITIARNQAVAAREVAEDRGYVTQIHLAQSHADAKNFALANETLQATDPARRNIEWGLLYNRCNQALATLPECRTAIFSPDGTQVVTTSRNNGINFVDAKSYQRLRSIGTEHQSDKTLWLRFSRDASKLFGAHMDGYIKVWDVATSTLIGSFGKGANRSDSAADISPNGELLAMGNDDGTVTVWDIASKAQLFIISGFPGSISAVQYSPDGRMILACGAKVQTEGGRSTIESIVKVSDATTGAEIFVCNGQNATFNASGTRIAVALADTITLYDAGTGTPIASAKSSDNHFTVIKFTPDGARIAVGSTGGTITIFDAESLDIVAATEENGKRVFTIDTSADGLVLGAFLPDLVQIWDINTGKLVNTLEGHGPQQINTACFDPTGKFVVTGSADDTVKLWESRRTPLRRTLVANLPPVNTLAISQDQQFAAVLLRNRTMEIRRIDSGAVVAAMASYSDQGGSVAAFSPDGTRIVAALDEFTPMVWDIATQQVVCAFTGHNGVVFTLSFSPDGNRVVSGSWDDTATVWDASTGKELFVLRGPTESVRSVKYSPDGSVIATGYDDGMVCLWNASNGALLHSLKGHTGAVLSVAFRSDSALLASSSTDNTVRTWDVQSGSALQILAGGMPMTGVAFVENDSRIIASSTAFSTRGTVVLSAQRGELLYFLKDDNAPHCSTAPFGNGLIGALENGRLVHYTPAPWRTMTSNATAHAARVDHSAADTPKRTIQPEVLAVAVAPQFAQSALKRLGETLLQTTTTSDSVSVHGPIYNALARFCVQQGDELISVNATPVKTDAIQPILAELTTQLSDKANLPTVSLSLRRNGTPITIACQFLQPLEEAPAISIDAAVVREYFRADRELRRQLGKDTLAVNRRFAENIGEPPADGDEFSGIWIPEKNSFANFKRFYKSAGLSFQDRLVRINGQPVRFWADVDALAKAIPEVGSSEFKWPPLEVERGQFQVEHISITVK